MEMEEIKAKLKEIETIVADLQEPVKTIATQELVAKILGTKQTLPTAPSTMIARTNKTSKKTTDGTSNKAATIQGDEEKDKEMMTKIDRTQYTEIHKLKKNIDRALFVLNIMEEKGYDGLNPSQICLILSDIFRIKSNIPAISMALINDKLYTSKIASSYKGTKANQYRIMQSGKEYIRKQLDEVNTHTGPIAEEQNSTSSREPSDNSA